MKSPQMREASLWITAPKPLKWVMCGPQNLPMLMEHEVETPRA